VRKVVGTPDADCWTQVHHFSGLEMAKAKRRGEMVLLLSLKGVPEETSTALGREVVSRVHEEYYGNLKGLPMERLRETLTKIGREKPIFLAKKINVSLLILVVWRRFVYLGLWGEGKIFLSRRGNVGQLLSHNQESVKLISGQVEAGDLYLLGTDLFYSQLPAGTIRACLETANPNSVVEILAPIVHGKKKQGGIGGALVKIEAIEEKDQEFLPQKSAVVRQEKTTKRSSKTVDWLKKKLVFRPKIRLSRSKRGGSGQRQKFSFTLAVGFLGLLLVSIFFGWQKKTEKEKQARFDNFYSQAEKKLVAAESIKNLDIQNSLTLARESVELLSQAIEAKTGEEKAVSLKQKADDLILILGGGERKTPDLFFNLKLLSQNAQGTSLFVSGNLVYVLDEPERKIYRLEWPSKASKIVAGGEFLAGKKYLAVLGKEVVYLASGDRLERLKSEKESEELLSLEGEIVSLASWANNLYLLDRGAKKLWKYSQASLSSGSKTSWFRQAPSFDWGELRDMDIDSRVWLLTSRGEIFNYYSGRKDNFSQKGGLVGKATSLAVAVDADRLVFWDEGDKTLWVLDKKGSHLAKIPLGLERVADLAISEKGEKVFLLSSGSLYWLDLGDYIDSGSILEQITDKNEG